MLLAALLLASVIETKPAPVFADVLIAGRGPYRFLVDTGSQTSLIDPNLAQQLGLRATFRVEVITQLSSRLLPGTQASGLRIGSHALPPLELVFHDLADARRLYPQIHGLLGLNALAGLNFTLSPSSGRLEIDAERPAGDAVPFYRLEERIALKARMGTETLTLILDSGSSHVVLFRTPAAMAKTHSVSHTFGTFEGARAIVPTTWTADMFFANRLRVGMQPAAIVKRANTEVEGLLPAAIFKKVYVDQVRRELILVR